MNLIQFSELIKQSIFIERRPCGEYISRFSDDCELLYNKNGHIKTARVQARGKTVNECLEKLIAILLTNDTIRLRFSNSFEPFKEWRIPQDLTYEPNIF